MLNRYDRTGNYWLGGHECIVPVLRDPNLMMPYIGISVKFGTPDYDILFPSIANGTWNPMAIYRWSVKDIPYWTAPFTYRDMTWNGDSFYVTGRSTTKPYRGTSYNLYDSYIHVDAGVAGIGTEPMGYRYDYHKGLVEYMSGGVFAMLVAMRESTAELLKGVNVRTLYSDGTENNILCQSVLHGTVANPISSAGFCKKAGEYDLYVVDGEALPIYVVYAAAANLAKIPVNGWLRYSAGLYFPSVPSDFKIGILNYMYAVNYPVVG